MSSHDTITLTGSTAGDTPAGEVTIPRELGPVRLVREIGRGGMGVVYLGRHQMLDRDVAVKFLLNAVAGPDDPGFAGFLEGARAAARLEHPGLTTIHHADVVDGIPYLVMQYVDGPALSDVLKQTGPLSLSASLAVLDAVSEAIGELHDRGIIHRDIKPGNVMLGLDGRVVVTDFGLALARPTGQRGPSSARLGGTPVYMAPEMFAGDVSLRSDVYALGIMTFELLTGELPFTGTFEEVRERHLHEPLPLEPLRQRQVDPAMIEVLERATHKNAMFRYKTAEYLRKALQGRIVTEELLREGAAELQELVLRALGAEPDATTTEAVEPTPTSSYFDRLAEIADEKRATREPTREASLERPAREDRAEASPLPPGDQPIEGGSIPGPPSAEPVRPNTLVADVPCAKCDYNLRGLAADGRCPECGEAVVSSLRPDRLMFADRTWLARIARGLTMIYIAVPAVPFLVLLVAVTGTLLAAYVLGPVPSFWSDVGTSMIVGMLVGLVAGLSTLVLGIFYSTTAEPRQSRGQLRRRTRWVVRILGVLFVSTLMTAVALRITGSLVPRLAWVLNAAPFSGLVVSFLLHLSTLGDRIPDLHLARRCRYLAMLLGLFVILNLAMPGELATYVENRTWFRWTLSAIGATSGIAMSVTIVWIWVHIGAYRRGIKRAVAASVSYDTLFGNVPTQVALPTREDDRAATPSPRAETPNTGGESTDVDEVASSVDFHCAHCGYNLRGLPGRSNCPECGTPIAQSLRSDLLWAADPAWLRRVHRGQAMMAAAWLMGMTMRAVDVPELGPAAFIPGSIDVGPAGVRSVISAVWVLASVLLLLVGAFVGTTLDPRLSLTEQPIALRRFVRLSLVVLVALEACSYSVPMAVIQFGADARAAALCETAFLWASGLVFLCALVAIFYYLATLAMRIPDATLASRTRSRGIGFVVSVAISSVGGQVMEYGGGTLVGTPWETAITVLYLPMFVYAILLVILMSAYQKAFRKCLLDAREHAGAQEQSSGTIRTIGRWFWND